MTYRAWYLAACVCDRLDVATARLRARWKADQ